MLNWFRAAYQDFKIPNFYQTPTQKSKNEFSIFPSQEIFSSLVSFEMIFDAWKSELFRFKFR